MELKNHWERVYSTKAPDAVSWYQEHAESSIRLIHATGAPKDAAIIDVGGGASTLVDDLLTEGYSRLCVLDVSGTALAAAKKRIGTRAPDVRWIEADITKVDLPPLEYDVWHDRAVFHFLTSVEDRAAYVRAVSRSVKPDGHVIVATFAEDGPVECSGLPVARYSPEHLHSEFGESFVLVSHEKEEHHTPAGKVQRFVYCYCRKGV
ncbi:MAG TPA: class I SAM-dependent methyltransferase [Thermoanaerobaculia bacterium]|nr:class I SAM-dependent methyltransferase [Thermoanaerobaculia bacterium]